MNILEAVPLTTFAKGCFLEGSMVATPNGQVAIEKLNPGDEITSFNEDTGQTEVSVIGDIDVLTKDHHWIINRVTRVTGEHPMYTTTGIVEVQNLQPEHVLVGRESNAPIKSLTRKDGIYTVYNLLDVTPNHNYYVNNLLVHNKGGGGCFLAGTKIQTPYGDKAINKLSPGDEVISYNETLKETQNSKIGQIQVLKAPGYYVINDSIKVTATHPMYVRYVTVDMKTVRVEDLKIGQELVTDAGFQTIRKIEYFEKEVTVYNLLDVEPNNNYYANNYLVHNKGSVGGRSSSSGSAKGTSAKTGSNSTSTPAKPKVGVSTAKPGSTIKTSDGKTVKSSTATPSKPGFSKTSKGIVGDNGYSPRFTNGYNPPAGSTVYYRDTSALDYLPWIYLFSQDNPATPQGQVATVVQPDGKQIEAKPVAQGTDGLAILNWIILIIIIGAIIGGIIWGVNKLTNKEKPKPKTPSYGSWY